MAVACAVGPVVTEPGTVDGVTGPASQDATRIAIDMATETRARLAEVPTIRSTLGVSQGAV